MPERVIQRPGSGALVLPTSDPYPDWPDVGMKEPR
jgi:hypothetical protein